MVLGNPCVRVIHSPQNGHDPHVETHWQKPYLVSFWYQFYSWLPLTCNQDQWLGWGSPCIFLCLFTKNAETRLYVSNTRVWVGFANCHLLGPFHLPVWFCLAPVVGVIHVFKLWYANQNKTKQKRRRRRVLLSFPSGWLLKEWTQWLRPQGRDSHYSIFQTKFATPWHRSRKIGTGLRTKKPESFFAVHDTKLVCALGTHLHTHDLFNLVWACF